MWWVILGFAGFWGSMVGLLIYSVSKAPIIDMDDEWPAEFYTSNERWKAYQERGDKSEL